MEEHSFYRVYEYSDRLTPGKELKIEHTLSFDQEKADLTDLTALPTNELETLKEASAKLEQSIFEKLCDAVEEWEQQGANTLRIVKAMEYVCTPEIAHTSNIWKKGEYEWNEISNRVYKMTYHIYENTSYDHRLKKSVPASWEVSWYVSFNQPNTPNYSGQSAHIAGQERKRYTDRAAMEKYLQGRKDAYAHLFTELSPTIPRGESSRFCVNGQLLPGYTVEPEREAVVAELLNFLESSDVEPAEPPKEKQHPKPHPKQKARSAPVR